MRKYLITLVGAALAIGAPTAALTIGTPTAALAMVSPTTGQHGSNLGNSCGGPGSGPTPGNSTNAPGSPFNPAGQAGNVYAGNPGTSSSLHSNSTAAVAQYDVACF